MRYPIVTMKTSGGTVEIELYPDTAPNTVNNFISLIKKGFYDGTIFHRIIPKFMIQGGDPKGNGTGGPGYCIRGEFTSNHFRNDLQHTRGVVSMARSVNPNSAGSQFFIMVDDAPYLDGEYAAFGRVISGMEEVDRIVSVPRDYDDRPLIEQKIISMTVETFGENYPEPKKV
jgi:peptidyl-prolyl cis-trans isomerase B (cyclophilin B)